MNAINRGSLFSLRRFAVYLMGALGAAMVSPAIAQNDVGAHLTAGTDIFDYTLGGINPLPPSSNGPAGNVPWNFQIQGAWGNPAERQIVSGNWFYRIDGSDDRERHFTDPAQRITAGSNYVYYNFDQIFDGGASENQVTDLSAEMDFALFDTGPNSSLLSTQVCFHNSGSATYDIDVFLAVDFNLAGDAPEDDYASLSPGGDLWTLTDSNSSGLWTGLMYGPSAVGAGAGNTSSITGAMTNTSITDFVATPLNHGGGVFTNGAAALQFHLTLSGPTHICIPAYLGIGLNVIPPLIPEPTSLALLALGSTVLLGRPPRRMWS